MGASSLGSGQPKYMCFALVFILLDFTSCVQAVLRRAKESGIDCLENPLAYVTLHKVRYDFFLLLNLARLVS